MPSQNIIFDTIGAPRTPGVYSEFNTRMAASSLPGNQNRTVIVGQRLAAGSVPANTVVDIFSEADAITYFGAGSIAHRMVRSALNANNILSLQAIAADDAGAGVQATGTTTIAGAATAPGVYTLNVYDDVVSVAYNGGDSAATVAAALNAAIAAAPPRIPVTATVLAGVVTLTAKNKGTLGNGIKLAASSTPNTGITAAVTAMANGATDPDITNTLAAIFTAGHAIVITAFNDATNLGVLRTHLTNVSSSTEKRRARGVFATTTTYAAATTLSSGLNSGRMLNALIPNANGASYELAAAFGAVAASEPDPAMPLNTLSLNGITQPPKASWLLNTQIEAALFNGVAPLRLMPDGTVQIVRAVTTYLTNASGVADAALLDWTTQGSMDYSANAIEASERTRFGRSKKTIRTQNSLLDCVYETCIKLQDAEIIQNVDKTAILIQNDLVSPTQYDIKVPLNVVSGLHVIAQRLDLIL